MNGIDAEADQVVAEMIGLGARFDVSRSSGDARWIYDPQPGTREAIRRYKAGLDLTRPGFEAAMVRAIMRTRYAGAP